MNEVPVLMFHKTYSNYLKVNCQITGKNNKIIFLGDSSCSKLEKVKNVQFYDFNDFIDHKKMDYYKSYFKSYNTKGDFIWIWYFRLFAILEFLEKSKIESIFHIDSDNVLLADINQIKYKNENSYFILNDWDEYHMTGSIHSGLTNKYFYNLFKNLYEDVFINESKLPLIQHKIDFHKKHGGGGICDMTFFYLMNKLKLLEVDNLIFPQQIGERKVIFMNNYGNGEGFYSRNQYEMKGKYIKIYKNREEGKNYIFDKHNNEYLELMNIHFQGKAKRHMNKYLTFSAIY